MKQDFLSFSEKVITAEEGRKLEKEAIKEGCSEEAFMDKAALGVFRKIEKTLQKNTEKRVYFLLGKGNNGGDGFTVASLCIEKKIEVIAYCPFSLEEISPLSQKKRKAFEEKGGKICSWEKEDLFPKKGIIVDALLGTGFKGSLEEPLKSLVQKANESSLPIFSIDIPSGLDATTGLVGNISIEAFHTTALGFYKTGYFLEKGWNVVGKLEKVVFGLPPEKEEKAAFSFLFLQKEKVGTFLPKIVKKRHKYQTGMVLGFSGTEEMEGAASLSSLAALRSGCGMMKLFFMGKEKPKKLAEEVIVHSFLEEKVVEEELKRAKAVYIGPGIGREKTTFAFLEKLIPQIKVPLVLDADALFFLSQKEDFSCKGAILTPHRKEMERLLHKEYEKDKDLIEASQQYVDTKEVILILKGAPTFIFSPKNKPFLSSFGDPGMAKAGSGDVLTGVVASLLAQGVPPLQATILAAVLQGISGEICAEEKSSYGFIASDLIKNLPKAFQKLLRENSFDTRKRT